MGPAPLVRVHRSRAAQRRTLGIMLLGCGERGSAQAQAIASARNAELVIAVDLSPDRARSIGERYGAEWTTEYAAALEHDGVEAVLLCLPHHLHASTAVQAAHAGKHLMVEKPLATSLQDARGVAKAARDAGVALTVCLNQRYWPHVQRARRLIEEGALGELLGLQFAYQRETPLSYWESGRTGEVQSAWRVSPEESGGGIVIGNVVHYLDWMMFLTGLDIVEVSATRASVRSPEGIEDALVMWARFANGALATINASYTVEGLRRPQVEFRMWGTEGHISLTPPYQFYSLRLVDGKRPGVWHAFGQLPRVDTLVACIERFAAAVLEGDQPEITGEHGVRLQAIIEGIYRSAGELRPIRIEAA